MKDKFDMVGKEINEFTLPNSSEESVNIRSYKGQKNVVIIALRDIR